MLRILLFAALIIAAPAMAAEPTQQKKDAFRSTNLPLPRFVSLRAKEIYVRTGPGAKYPVKWTYKKPGMPVEIILEFENWRKIKDIDGETGWAHQTLLSSKRTGIITGEAATALYKSPAEGSKMTAQVEPKTIVTLDECKGEWCEVDAMGYDGWVKKENIWGVYPDEAVD
jgi:SH3-like domain-containing protein